MLLMLSHGGGEEAAQAVPTGPRISQNVTSAAMYGRSFIGPA